MTVEVEASLGAPFTPDRRETLLEVSIEAQQKSPVGSRHVCLLVDTSTSMEGDKIEKARTGVERVLDALDEDDHVSIVGFDAYIQNVLPMTRWGAADRDAVYESVRGADADDDGDLVASGTTDIVNGLEAARDQFADVPAAATGVREIVLLSDGQDRRPIDEYESLARDIKEAGISIVAAGIGAGYEEDVMLALARESGGEPYNLDGSDDIESFLGERVREAGKVVSNNPTLHLDVDDEFMIDTEETAYFTDPRIVSQPIRSTEDGAIIDLLRLKDDAEQTLTVPLIGMPQPTGVTRPVADISVHEGDHVLAETSVETAYRKQDDAKRTVEKRRHAAKIVADMSEGDADDRDIEKAIGKLREKGWSKVAADLEDRLDKKDDDGGGIEITKQPIDQE